MPSDASMISVRGLGKSYQMYDKPSDRLKQLLWGSLRKRPYGREFWALRDVSLDVRRGEVVGIVGRNGSGKSTLLQCIAGTVQATQGTIEVNGRLAALLELGSGFNPDFTGRENVLMYGAILGMSRAEMEKRFDAIAAFAEIGEFIDQPVKTYSSGMVVRLAFAVSTQVEPEILIVDEALAVGDIRFQQKCLRRIEEFSRDRAVLFVSHDLGAVTRYCQRVVWLKDGQIAAEGDPDSVCRRYQAYMLGTETTTIQVQTEAKLDAELGLEAQDARFEMMGDGLASITGVSFFSEDCRTRAHVVRGGERVRLAIRVAFRDTICEPIVGFTIRDRLGNIMAQSNSYVIAHTIRDGVGGEARTFCFRFDLPLLNDGEYTISPAIASGTLSAHVQHCWVHDSVLFRVANRRRDSLQGFLLLDGVTMEQVS